MNWLDVVFIVALIISFILGAIRYSFVSRLLYCYAVFSVLVFSTSIVWIIIWILETIPSLDVITDIFYGAVGPVFISIVIGLMSYLILLKLYRDATICHRIQSATKWRPSKLINIIGSGLATAGIAGGVLSILIVPIMLFWFGGDYNTTSLILEDWTTVEVVAGSVICRSSLYVVVWLFSWKGVLISLVLIGGFSVMLRRAHSATRIKLTEDILKRIEEPTTKHSARPGSVREYLERKAASFTETSLTDKENKTTGLGLITLLPFPSLTPTADAAKSQKCLEQARAFETAGELEKAIEEYTKAMRLDSKNAQAYFKRGLLLKEMGMKPAAISDFRRVIDASDSSELIDKAKSYIAEMT
jgi:hypothetical protein